MRGSSTLAQRFGPAGRLSNVDVAMDKSPGPDEVVPWAGTFQHSQGDVSAALSVSELFRNRHLELVRLAVVMAGDLATAEDVVQDSFERLHRRWPAVREPSRALACARSSVLNDCRSVHRRSADCSAVARLGSALACPSQRRAGACCSRSVRVSKLPVHVPPTVAIDNVALSPDGTRLAMTAQWNCGRHACGYTGIRVVNLATDAVTIWSTRINGGAVARIVELNARTGHVERTLYRATPDDQSENLDQACNVLSLGPGGRHPLVGCFSKLGALVNGQIVSMPGFSSASSSGISGQQAIAW